MNVKQVIVMRTDLNMRKGKMVSQGAHSSIAWLSNKIRATLDAHGNADVSLTVEQIAWIVGLFTKICVKVKSEAELLAIYEKAKEAGLTVELITDAGLTEFGGVPTNTCLAIGPHEVYKIDAITGNLELL